MELFELFGLVWLSISFIIIIIIILIMTSYLYLSKKKKIIRLITLYPHDLGHFNIAMF